MQTKLQRLFGQDIVLGALILLAIVFLQGLYAVQLNQAYYSINMPFFDSLTYYGKLNEIINQFHQKGWLTALNYAVSAPPPTSVLPFLEAVIIAPFVESSRAIGIWLQVIWLWVLGVSVFFYLRYFYVNSLWLSLGLTLPVIGLAALWNYNGGLSDFRVDLHLYLFWGIAFTWFFITYETSALYPWIIWGIAVGLMYLARTFSPVYLVIVLLPLLSIRLLFPDQLPRIKLIRNTLIGIAIALIISGWFYVLHFKDVYYYYAVWGPDTNTSLSFTESLRHVKFALKSIGWYPLILGAIVVPFTLQAYLKQYPFTLIGILKDIDWKILWVGLAPLALLIIKRAGLNPFISMPATFGLILFLVKPLRKEVFIAAMSQGKNAAFSAESVISSASIFLLVVSAFSGMDNHLYPDARSYAIYPNPQAYQGGLFPTQTILKAMLSNAEAQGLKTPTYSVTYLAVLNNDSLYSILNSDTSVKLQFQQSIQPIPYYAFSHYAPTDWKNVPGNTDADRIVHLVNIANQNIDYLIIPEPQSANLIGQNPGPIVINQFSPAIRAKLMDSQNWTPITEVVTINELESVRIYRNEQRFSKK